MDNVGVEEEEKWCSEGDRVREREGSIAHGGNVIVSNKSHGSPLVIKQLSYTPRPPPSESLSCLPSISLPHLSHTLTSLSLPSFSFSLFRSSLLLNFFFHRCNDLSLCKRCILLGRREKVKVDRGREEEEEKLAALE